ncbi:MAG TPA: glycosyltransferase family 2 protein [Thermodesulfovibrionales bacterium]|nr:glycosyltransferase family 2 protein [Thermodesulfovibrionales bacterium]
MKQVPLVINGIDATEAKTSNEKIPLTAIVVTYNEAPRLRNCLESLAFCDQLLVVDLGSADESVRIAQECGAEVFHHDWVPFVERVLRYALSFARNDWVLRFDPDEAFPKKLVNHLMPSLVQTHVAIVGLPYQYYFLGKPLRTTIWGGKRMMSRKLFHKDRVEISPYVHQALQCKPGYAQINVEPLGDDAIQHFWVDSFEQLSEKHRRYLRYEGESRYRTGQRFAWHKMFYNTLRSLGENLVYRRGLFGGFSGIFLSFYHSWYVCRGWLSLREYERNLSHR